MDNFPLDLTRQIIQFARGNTIVFNRDDSGRIQEIIGITNGEDNSHIVFNYETDRISAHALCINEKDELSPTDLIFCDVHLNLPINNCWSYIANITEIDQNNKNINKYHISRKIVLNGAGKLETILDANEPIYSARYNNDGLLVCEHQNGIEIQYGYNDLGSTISKKSFRGKKLLEQWSYEYNDSSIGPCNEFLETENGPVLKQVNSYLKDYIDGYSVKMLPDGIRRNYYTRYGDKLSSVYLPKNIRNVVIDYTLEDLINQPDLFPSIEFSIVDKSTGSIRTVQREDGYLLVDQTAIFRDGLLSKVINQKASLYNFCSLSLFEKEWWKQIVYRVDPVIHKETTK